MTTALTHCAAGCVIRDAHTDPAADCTCVCHTGGAFRRLCDVPGGCHASHPEHPADCGGCAPRLATVGVLCEQCAARLAAAIVLAPEMVLHLRSLVPPGAPAPRTGVRHRNPDPAAPLNLPAIDAADLIFALLVSWTDATCDALHLTGPPTPRTWTTPTSAGQPAGLPAGATGREALPYAQFLRTHLDRITGERWAADMVTSDDPDHPALTTVVHRARRTWPLDDNPQYLTDHNGRRHPCPDCDRLTLLWHPPIAPGLDPAITCDARDCGYTLPTHRWDPETRRVLTDQQADQLARDRFHTAAGAP